MASAEIYQWKDNNGQTHYSDTAPKDKPELEPKNITIPTAMQATKIQPKEKEKSGPSIIMIGSPTPGTDCVSQKINSEKNNKSMEMWQDYEWKNCHGMK